jgi:hypothetical protein
MITKRAETGSTPHCTRTAANASAFDAVDTPASGSDREHEVAGALMMLADGGRVLRENVARHGAATVRNHGPIAVCVYVAGAGTTQERAHVSRWQADAGEAARNGVTTCVGQASFFEPSVADGLRQARLQHFGPGIEGRAPCIETGPRWHARCGDSDGHASLACPRHAATWTAGLRATAPAPDVHRERGKHTPLRSGHRTLCCPGICRMIVGGRAFESKPHGFPRRTVLAVKFHPRRYERVLRSNVDGIGAPESLHRRRR